MRNTIRCILLLSLLVCTGFGNEILGQGLDSLYVSLLTCGPGEDVYSIFGHSAVRVRNYTDKQDYVFNYGTFDFNEPGFYQNFLKGKLNYKLAVHTYPSFIRSYRRQERPVIEQIILLSSENKNRLNEFLINNYLPENRDYLYDFFYDNCSTRIRDIFDRHLGLTIIAPPENNRNLSFRQGLDQYNHSMPWIDFGMDLILGIPADKKMNFRQEMYLPDYLSQNIAQYLIVDQGKSETLLSLPNPIVSIEKEDKTPLPWPLILFSLLFFLLLAYQLFFNNDKINNIIDVTMFSLLGIGGFIIAFMWFGTDHLATKDNLNLAWLHPLYLILAYLIIKNKKWIFPFIAVLIVNVSLMATWSWLPQQLHLAVLPILGIISLRCLYRIKSVRDKAILDSTT